MIFRALVSVGRGSQDEGHIERLLALKNRRKGDVTAPACGLHFVDSLYDERFDLPKEPLGPNLLAFTGEWTGERQLPDNPRIAARRKLTFNSQAPLNQPEPAPSEQQETPL